MIGIIIWLVVLTILKNMSSSMGRITFHFRNAVLVSTWSCKMKPEERAVAEPCTSHGSLAGPRLGPQKR